MTPLIFASILLQSQPVSTPTSSCELRVEPGQVCVYESETMISYLDTKSKKRSKQMFSATDEIRYKNRIGTKYATHCTSVVKEQAKEPVTSRYEWTELAVGDPTVKPAERMKSSFETIGVIFPVLKDWRPDYVFRVGQKIFVPIEASRFEQAFESDNEQIENVFFDFGKAMAQYRVSEITATEVTIEASYNVGINFYRDDKKASGNVQQVRTFTYRRTDGVEMGSTMVTRCNVSVSPEFCFEMVTRTRLVSERMEPVSKKLR